jgi:long-chain acyl-CoA synthetase
MNTNMYHPSFHRRSSPEKIAYRLVPSGEAVTYRELDDRSIQASHLLRKDGLRRGDTIAILMENNARYFELTWAADRSGLYYTCISNRLSPPEVAYIVKDCGASVLFTSRALLSVGAEVVRLVPGLQQYLVDGHAEGFRDYLVERDQRPTEPIADESWGMPMLYSSGTTGRPKGVKFDLPDSPFGSMDGLTEIGCREFAFSPQMIYLSPAPFYHSASLRWSMTAHRLGATVIAMENFDAQLSLEVLEKYHVTHSQWVPTHFVRMLKLDKEVREKFDLSGMKVAFHAAAPCPVPVKQAMMDWWGPIIHEFYAGTEFNGLTSITPEEWLSHRGSVGKATFGQIHICGEDANELPVRGEGLIYFEGGTRFSYYNDPEKTAEAYDARGWSTLGDIGWVDEEGYLYLTDRKSFMVICGGVNIYPQEIEDVIVTHPRVADAAVIGAPDEDMGERLVAIVQPLDWKDATDEVGEEIKAYVMARLAKFKVPRQVDFMRELPRHPTGKLYKRLIRAEYWKDVEHPSSRPKQLSQSSPGKCP